MVLEVLDPTQEQAAKTIGDGHRIIAGVAGSGKTILLQAHAKLLATEGPHKRILLLCYNRVLGNYLKGAFADDSTYCGVEVFTFHAWANARTKLTSYQGESFDRYEQRLLPALLHETQNAPDTSRYDAILIDEAQDFKPEWFPCCVRALRLDPPGDLLVAVDGAQSLYGQPQSFTWKSVGINASGRSKRLGVNYRNTQEILALAWEVAQAEQPDDESETHVRIKPEKARRHGPMPIYRTCQTEIEEQAIIAELIRSFKALGLADTDIAVLYARQGGTRINNLVAALRRTENVVWISDATNRLARDRWVSTPGVRVCTIHSAKGLEFPAVILCAVDQMPNRNNDELSEAHLLYVALTRAMNHLAVTWTGQSAFTQRIEKSGRAEAQPSS
jgi:superfamily I DNA/RNA helicase